MNTKEAFEITGHLGNKIKKLKEQLEEVNKECLDTMELCPHEIIFKYRDNYPRRLYIDGTYFCPACGKSIKCLHENQILETQFNDSRIIPLTNLSLIGTNETYRAIREEVYDNIDYYYDRNIPIEELSSKMELVLEDKQDRYNYQDIMNTISKKIEKELKKK